MRASSFRRVVRSVNATLAGLLAELESALFPAPKPRPVPVPVKKTVQQGFRKRQ